MKKINQMVLLASLGASFIVNAQSKVNVAHLAPFADSLGATAVSVDVNDSEALSDFRYKQVSGYVTLSEAGVAPGSTDLKVFAPPGADAAAISATVDLSADTDYTVAAIGDGDKQPLSLLPLVDDNSAPDAGNAKIRVVHAAPFAQELADTAVSIRLDSGDVVNNLSSVEFAQSSGYFQLPEGTYDLQVATVDGTTALIDLAPVGLSAGDVLTLFAIGGNGNQPLGVLAVFADGSSARLPLETDFNGINAGLNGAWFSPNTSSQGFMLEVLPDREEIFFAWFTYDVDLPDANATAVVGAPGQRWLSGQGGYDAGTGVLDLVLTSNGKFVSADEATVSGPGTVGTVSIRFISCSQAELTYNLISSGLSGMLTLNRIAADNVSLCENLNVLDS